MTKRKLIILYPANGPVITGGQKYNSILFKIIRKKLKSNVDFLFDYELLKENKINCLTLLYILKISEIKKYENILVDSRFYFRYILLFIIVRTMYKGITLRSIHHHFDGFSENNMFKKPIRILLEFLFLSLCHEIIVPSDFTKNKVKQYFKRKNVNQLSLGFVKNYAPIKIGFDNRKIRLIYIGTISKRKGTIYLVKAINKLYKKNIVNFNLDITGMYSKGNKYYKKIFSYIQKYNLSEYISFSGRVNQHVLESKLTNSDCLILPSTYEGFGMVIAESFIKSIPVIAFDNSAIHYIIKDNFNGILCKNKSISSLSKSIKSLLLNPSLIGHLSKGAHITANDLTSVDEMHLKMANWVTSKLLS